MALSNLLIFHNQRLYYLLLSSLAADGWRSWRWR
jgi:hypothetical protein